ncbi:TonB-dependent vitamin B12 receptor [Luteimonas aquatica]|uniref:TonB-dependent vitamin B12 receptor n=1 Tax=Luteimonas aquatica TaxID=450364 RepID=UPI001F596F47|nr:TonB-dependent vitamin B12 receptor [Luteimonas aquatica]
MHARVRPYALSPLAAACALLLSPAAFAAGNPAADAAIDLDEVVVTGTRTEVPLIDSLFPAEVIDREEIERSQARDLPDLLRGRAGVDIGNSGGAGKVTSVFLRGSGSGHVLVLVDGVRMGAATNGAMAFQDLPVEQIDRIEIVRGPRSSLYGSEAIGGVIQIFTRRDQGKFTPHFRLGAGSHNLREASAGFGGGGARGWYGADVAYSRTDGIDACRGSAALFAGCFADEPDRDGNRNRSLNLRGGLNIGETLGLEAHALRAEADTEFDGSPFAGNFARNVQQVVGGKLAWKPSERLAVNLQAGRSDDKADSYFQAPGAARTHVSTFDTRRDTASLQGDFTLAENHLLTAGLDWQNDRITSTADYAETERDNTGVFAEYQGSFGAHQLQLSVRNDDNEQFGNHTTGGLGWGMKFGDGFRLSANYATGFKAPTFNDLYFPGSASPDLDPETSKTLNLGIGQHTELLSWTFNVYESRFDDLIVFVYPPPLYVGQGYNVDKARVRGAELTFATTVFGWDLSTQWSLTSPRNRSRRNPDGTPDADYGNLLARRARNTGRIDLDRAFGDFRVGVTVAGASYRYDNPANTVASRLHGYATADLRLEYALSPAWTLQARASNVFDKRYETVQWYNQPGREYGISVRYRPQ